jgi:hypothetical protein
MLHNHQSIREPDFTRRAQRNGDAKESIAAIIAP